MAIDTNKTPILSYPFPQGTYFQATRGQSNTEFIVPSNGVFPPDSGGYLRNDGSGTLTWSPTPASGGLYAQTATSTPITNTTVETTLLDGGVGTLTVPANTFVVGDSFSVSMGGHITCVNNHTLHIRVKRNGTVLLADTGIISMPQCTAKHWDLTITFTIRKIGGPGVAEISSYGTFLFNKDSNNQFEGATFSIVNNTTFDTTINNTLNITAQWGTASVNDIIYSDMFVLHKTY